MSEQTIATMRPDLEAFLDSDYPFPNDQNTWFKRQSAHHRKKNKKIACESTCTFCEDDRISRRFCVESFLKDGVEVIRVSGLGLPHKSIAIERHVCASKDVCEYFDREAIAAMDAYLEFSIACGCELCRANRK